MLSVFFRQGCDGSAERRWPWQAQGAVAAGGKPVASSYPVRPEKAADISGKVADAKEIVR